MSSEPHGKLSVLLGSYGNMGCGIAHMSADQHLRLFSDLHTCAMCQGYLLVYIPTHTCSMHKYIQIKERFWRIENSMYVDAKFSLVMAVLTLRDYSSLQESLFLWPTLFSSVIPLSLQSSMYVSLCVFFMNSFDWEYDDGIATGSLVAHLTNRKVSLGTR